MTDEVDKELLNEFYQELADLIGLENAYKLHETYRGYHIRFRCDSMILKKWRKRSSLSTTVKMQVS